MLPAEPTMVKTSLLHSEDSRQPFDTRATIFTRQISEQRKKDLWNAASQVLASVYDNPAKLTKDVEANLNTINRNSKMAAAVALIIRQGMLTGFLDFAVHHRLKDRIKPKKAHSDIHVPTNEEVQDTVSKLEAHHRLAYSLLLYSGIRVSEAQYLLDRKDKLKVQQYDGFVKVTLDWSRGSKNALFAYMPTE
ncbi:MAG: integrase, partial [Candidatus Micrarchaeota archaeon]|nr:integrase [Candidatus Micrarchaeota archaeon]